MTTLGHKFERKECPVCKKMIASNWWKRHARLHQPGIVVALTPEAQDHLAAIGIKAGAEQTVEKALRIYRSLGSFIDMMMTLGLLPYDFGMNE